MGHDKYEGMFVGSELGFSYHCKCGWTSERYATEGEAFEAASQHEKGGESTVTEQDVSWVQRTETVDAVDRNVVEAIEGNPGWKLLHVGMGSGGQTTLTYGWPRGGDSSSEPYCSDENA